MTYRSSDQGVLDTRERELVERAKEGDQVAFSDIYRAHRKLVTRFVLARVDDRAAAEEIVQETFLRALLAMKRMNPDRALGPWLRSIAGNLIIDRHRTGKWWVASDRADAILDRRLATADTTLQAVLTTEGIAQLQRAIAELPARQRRILLANVMEELSPAELAALENVSEASVHSIVYRARNAVRRNLRRLATVFVALRIRVRMRDKLHRLARVHDNLTPATEWGLATGGLCIALITAAVLGVGPGGGPRSPHARAPRSVVVEAHERENPPLPVEAARTGAGPPVSPSGPPVKARAGIGRTREHALTPSSSHLRVEVHQPDGGTVFVENEHDCNGVASNVLPRSGPVTATC